MLYIAIYVQCRINNDAIAKDDLIWNKLILSGNNVVIKYGKGLRRHAKD